MSATAAETVTEEVKEKPRLKVAFRKAAQRDIKSVAKVFERAFAEDNEFGNPTSYLNEFRQDKDHDMIVAEAQDGRIAGFIMTSHDDEIASNSVYVDQLAVDPDFQGYGIGRKLMNKAEESALRDKFSSVTLHVRKDNDKAIGLYTSLGFHKVGAQWWYYQDGTTGVEMLKDLGITPANDNAGWGIGKMLKKVFHLSP